MAYEVFTKEQREQARNTDIAEFLRMQGETLKRSGSEWEWLDGTQKVTIRGNVWFHQYERVGGDAVDFVCRFYRKDYPGAVYMLLGVDPPAAPVVSQNQQKKEKRELHLQLPPKNATSTRAFAYLLRRGIDGKLLFRLFGEGLIYESGIYHNAVFVGCDRTGAPKHASLRGTTSRSTFKGNADASDPRFAFHYAGPGHKLYLFEAPIDMLSYITMHQEGWQLSSYAACCGVSDYVLWQMLADNPQIDTVYLCLDNDEAGDKAVGRIGAALSEKGIRWERCVPRLKDWNEDLAAQLRMPAAPANEPDLIQPEEELCMEYLC